MKQLLHPLINFLYARIYRLTKHWRTGAEPLDPEELMHTPDRAFWAVPTFRYFKVWPWDGERPRWLPAYRTPDYTPLPANFVYPERLALNDGRPEEAYSGGRGDRFLVVESRRGAPVRDGRFSAHGRQHYSDVWCKIRLSVEFLRPDQRRVLGEEVFAWVPAIWLTYDKVSFP